MADEADGSVVLAQLQVSLESDNQGFVHPDGHSPVFKIVLQTGVRTSIMASPSALTNSAGMLSIADSPSSVL